MPEKPSKSSPGRPGDEIRVDVVEAAAAGERESLVKLRGRMAAANGFEDAVPQGLGIDADAVAPAARMARVFPP